ncbi:protein kinase [Streptomyces sp. OF8]|uniref:Protein kinase n=1 Tax=Streptomyces alkaliterrae TaxID=2213162 RepID=A0A5P0YV60_9ACTN|nr:protein kinase [Streptomyces alkaliterrae]MQS03850.1 protein kinase [Streptomyces alkaliterrae]
MSSPLLPDGRGPGRIGPYEVFHLLGEGGMGRVFLARSPGGRLVALKVIRPEYAEAPQFRARFRREAAAAQRVSGFFTPAVLEVDADAYEPWLATVYVPAPSLHEVVRRFGTLPAPALRALGTGLAEALLAIHRAGVVHRDLKPGNVLVAEDGPRVIDFGISRAVDATRVTHTDAVMGTPGFMAPEQIVSSREAGPEADVFSLGCVLAFAATGQGPFGGGGTSEVLYRAVHAPPALDGVPDGLRPLLAECLEKDPAHRPSADAVLAALAALGSAVPEALLVAGLREELARRAAQVGALVAAPSPPATPPAVAGAPSTASPGRPSRRRFLWIAGAAAGTAVVAAGAAAATGWWSGSNAPAARRGTGAGTTVRPSPRAPTGPDPEWSSSLLPQVENGQLRLLGDTLVHFDRKNASGYDTATGKRLWTADPAVPKGVSSGVNWLGVHGKELFAAAWSGDRGYLLRLGADGRVKSTVAVTERGRSFASHVDTVFDAAGSVAVIGTSDDPGYAVRAVDLAAERVLWHREVGSSDHTACSDGKLCYVYDGDRLIGLDLRTGAVRWTVRDLFKPGTYPSLATDGTAVLVTGTKVLAFGATDGRELWTAVNESYMLRPATVLGRRAYVVGTRDTVHAVDTRDGGTRWHATSPLSLATNGARDPGPAVTPSVVAYPLSGSGSSAAGFAVWNASGGKLLWAHQEDADSTPTAGSTTRRWQVRARGDTLYAASDTTLHAFRSTTP